MEENKVEEKKCCGSGNACGSCKTGSCCGHKCCKHGCHGLFKILVPIILLALAFYLGAMVGRGDDVRGRMQGQRFIDKVDEVRGNINKTGSGSATVNVFPQEKTEDTQNPPVLE